jgi:hypothetical protein
VGTLPAGGLGATIRRMSLGAKTVGNKDQRQKKKYFFKEDKCGRYRDTKGVEDEDNRETKEKKKAKET